MSGTARVQNGTGMRIAIGPVTIRKGRGQGYSFITGDGAAINAKCMKMEKR